MLRQGAREKMVMRGMIKNFRRISTDNKFTLLSILLSTRIINNLNKYVLFLEY